MREREFVCVCACAWWRIMFCKDQKITRAQGMKQTRHRYLCFGFAFVCSTLSDACVRACDLCVCSVARVCGL